MVLNTDMDHLCDASRHLTTSSRLTGLLLRTRTTYLTRPWEAGHLDPSARGGTLPHARPGPG